jgi:hypothetical protein
VVDHCSVGITQVFGRTVSQIVAPFTFSVYLVIATPPSKVEAPHETVNLLIASATADKRVGAPGATIGVCIACAVFALDSVVAWSVTVTTLNSYAGSSGSGGVEGAGAGVDIVALVTAGAEI